MSGRPVTRTVTRLAQEFGLSRTTLLYYERIGLLRPSGRSKAGYRVYGDQDVARLREICRLRTTGLALRSVRRALDAKDDVSSLLSGRLQELESEIEALRRQQRIIVGLLKVDASRGRLGAMNKARWSKLLRSAGFSEGDMEDWHADFERTAPDEHQAFLEALLISDEEIAAIRARSRARGEREEYPRRTDERPDPRRP